jgi:NAD(P)H-flavin reductase
VDIEVSSDVHAQYRHPGQYLKVRRMDGGNPTLFSMASPPDNRNILSFLIKESSHHEFVLNMREGEQIDLSAPIGAGFRIEERIHQCRSDFHVNNILMIACGSGLAPIAAAIESNQLGLQQGDEDSVPSLSSLIAPPRMARLYIGARTPAHLPYADRYPTWREKGIEVLIAVNL